MISATVVLSQATAPLDHPALLVLPEIRERMVSLESPEMLVK